MAGEPWGVSTKKSIAPDEFAVEIFQQGRGLSNARQTQSAKRKQVLRRQKVCHPKSTSSIVHMCLEDHSCGTHIKERNLWGKICAVNKTEAARNTERKTMPVPKDFCK